MKKKLIISIAIISVALLAAAACVNAKNDIKLIINGKLTPASIEVIDESSYVPLRLVSEALGAKVEWDEDTQTITITAAASSPVDPSQAEAPRSATQSPSPSPTKSPSIAPSATPTVTPTPSNNQTNSVYYKNCTDAKANGAYNIKRGEPGYRAALDRDNDGVACEK